MFFDSATRASMGHVQVANFIDVFTRFVMVNTSGTPSSSRAIGHCNSPTIWGHALPSQQVFVPNEKRLYMCGIIYDWLYHMSYAIKEHIGRSLTCALDGQSCGCNQIWLYAYLTVGQADVPVQLPYVYTLATKISSPWTSRDPSLPGCRPTSLVMGTRHHFVARQQAQNHHTV